MTDLPDGMVSAQDVQDAYDTGDGSVRDYVAARDAQWAAALAGANSMIGIRESELELAQGRAAAAESRIADLKHQLGEYADKLDCMVDPEEHRQKLAASQAEVRELREALVPFSKCPHWGNHPMSMPEPCDNCTAAMLLSRPTGTQDALRAVCEKVWDAACESVQKVERAYASGQMWLITKEETRAADLARVLGEVAK